MVNKQRVSEQQRCILDAIPYSVRARMRLSNSKVKPLPGGVCFSGVTAMVTGVAHRNAYLQIVEPVRDTENLTVTLWSRNTTGETHIIIETLNVDLDELETHLTTYTH